MIRTSRLKAIWPEHLTNYMRSYASKDHINIDNTIINPYIVKKVTTGHSLAYVTKNNL